MLERLLTTYRAYYVYACPKCGAETTTHTRPRARKLLSCGHCAQGLVSAGEAKPETS